MEPLLMDCSVNGAPLTHLDLEAFMHLDPCIHGP